MKYWREFTCIFVFCLSSVSTKAEILVRHPLASPLFFAEILKSRSSAQSYSQFLDASVPTAQQKQTLTAEFEKAQRAFLMESAELAKQNFAEMAAQVHKADWDSDSRRMLFYSMARLAQLSSNQEEKAGWLEKAFSFAPEMEWDSGLYPPPLTDLARIIRTRIQARSVRWLPFNNFRAYNLILVDGRRFENREGLDVVLTPGEHRLSLFSDIYPPFTQIMLAEDIREFRLERQPLVSGSCQNPQLRPGVRFEKQDLLAVFEEDCLLMLHGEGWTRLATDGAKPVVATPLSMTTFPPIDNATTNFWNKKTWFWIGVASAAVVAALVIRANQQPANTITQPTHE